MTLAQLRALLALSHGPAVERVQRLPENAEMVQWPPSVIAAPYLPKDVRVIDQPSGHDVAVSLHTALMWDKIAGWSLDLTDPGTVVAVRAALALARGFDPSNGVKWTRNGADNAWILDASDWCAFATSTAARSVTPSRRVIEADLVGMEPDSTRALILAVEHVLGASEGR